MFDEVRAEIGENRDATEVGFERTRPVCRIHLGPEALRAEQDLQDRAEHLEHHRVLQRPHGGRARVEVEAGHLAEEIARPELRHRVRAREVDRRIDRDHRAGAGAVVLLRFAHEQALHLEAEPPEGAGVSHP